MYNKHSSGAGESPSRGSTGSYKSHKRSSTLSLSSKRRMMGRGDGKKLDTYGPPSSKQGEPGATTTTSTAHFFYV